jgi:hypothetical protein
MGQSLMTQAELDALRLEGCFEPGFCRLPGRETKLKPKKECRVSIFFSQIGSAPKRF